MIISYSRERRLQYLPVWIWIVVNEVTVLNFLLSHLHHSKLQLQLLQSWLEKTVRSLTVQLTIFCPCPDTQPEFSKTSKFSYHNIKNWPWWSDILLSSGYSRCFIQSFLFVSAAWLTDCLGFTCLFLRGFAPDTEKETFMILSSVPELSSMIAHWCWPESEGWRLKGWRNINQRFWQINQFYSSPSSI